MLFGVAIRFRFISPRIFYLLPTGRKFTDIHREFLDDVRIPSLQGKGELRRVEEVFDCWFEHCHVAKTAVRCPEILVVI